MDKLSNRRLTENEVIFKHLNSEVKDFVLQDGKDTIYATKRLRFYCECSNVSCRERIAITAQEYDDQHSKRKWFIVKPGHSIPEIERVIKYTPEYELVQKKEVPPLPQDINPKDLLPDII